MVKRTSVAQQLALKAAAVARDVHDEEPAAAPPPPRMPEPPPEEASTRRKGGRPVRRRQVMNKQTVYLDERRYHALVRAAENGGRSIHSLMLEGIDLVLGKLAESARK